MQFGGIVQTLNIYMNSVVITNVELFWQLKK